MTCDTCNGAGQVRMQQGFFTVQQTCPRCQGRGKVISEPCGKCRGQGRVRKQKTLSVKVPAGVDTGDRIRLAGEGEAGRNGGPAGDLYVEVRVREHPIFERDGAHLSCEVPISFATRGARRQRSKCRRSTATSRSRCRRRRSRGACSGCARRASSPCAAAPTGDLFCRVVVETPVNLTASRRTCCRVRGVAAARTASATTRARSPGSTA